MRLRLQRTVREIDQVAGFRWARGEKLRRVVFGAASGGPRLVSWSIVDVAQSTALLLRRLRDYGLGRGHDGGDRGRDPYCSAGRRSHRTATCSQAPCRRLWNPLGPNFRRSGGSAIQAPRTPLGIGIIVRPERSEPAEAHRRRRCCRRARELPEPSSISIIPDFARRLLAAARDFLAAADPEGVAAPISTGSKIEPSLPPGSGARACLRHVKSRLTSVGFTGVLLKHGVAISMDGRGAWRDNVFVERLWRNVKHEEACLRAYDSSQRGAQLGQSLSGLFTIIGARIRALTGAPF